jgi:hypothetical protein
MNRRNRAEYANALASMRRWSREGQPEGWTSGEWDNLVARAAAQKPESRDSFRIPLLRPLVSAAAALIVLVWATLFLLKIRPEDLSARNEIRPAEAAAPAAGDVRTIPETIPTEPDMRVESAESRPGAFSERRNLFASAARTPRPAGDKPAFTWISPDTGLQIVWFTNNNLKLEEYP